MTTDTATRTRPSAAPSPVSPFDATPAEIAAVWDRLWLHTPDDAKDDALIERERRSPRWFRIRDELTRKFGSLNGLRTVELGSGRGDLSVLLSQMGAEVTLLDASDRALDQARHRFDRLQLKASFVRGDMMEPAAGLSPRFQFSLSSGVIEHFRGSDRTRVTRCHHDVLSPGGMTAISVPHSWCLPYRMWKFYLERRGWWPYGMEIPYSKRELVGRVESVGFMKAGGWCSGFWQSVSDQCVKQLLGRRMSWAEAPSILDATMGLVLLVMTERKP